MLSEVLMAVPRGMVIVLWLVLLLPGGASADGAAIRVNGTGSGVVVIKALVAAYQKVNPAASFDMQKSLGSAAAIKALTKGALDIALSGRPLNAKESADPLVMYEYGRTPFAVIANRKSAPQNVTYHELALLFSGKTAVWPNGEPVRPVLRPQEDVDSGIARGMSPEMDRAFVTAAGRTDQVVGMTDQDAFDLVKTLPGGIGLIGLVLPLSEPHGVKLVKLNGVAPTLENLSSGRYPVYKKIFIVTRKDASFAVREFLAFLNSPKGRAVAARCGLLTTGKAK